MTLTFNVTEEDYTAFLAHHWKTSPVYRRMMRISGVVGTIGIALPNLMHNLPGDIPVAITSALIAVVPYLVFLFIFRRFGAVIMRPLLISHAREAVGPITLDMTTDGLRERSKSGETVFFWDRIGDVVTTPTHTLIYQGLSKAIIIPHNRITGGNYHTFMQAFADVYTARQDAALGTVAGTGAPLTIPESRKADSTENTTIRAGRTDV